MDGMQHPQRCTWHTTLDLMQCMEYHTQVDIQINPHTCRVLQKYYTATDYGLRFTKDEKMLTDHSNAD